MKKNCWYYFLFLLNACSSDKNIVINKQLNNDVEIYNSGLELLKKKNLMKQ